MSDWEDLMSLWQPIDSSDPHGAQVLEDNTPSRIQFGIKDDATGEIGAETTVHELTDLEAFNAVALKHYIDGQVEAAGHQVEEGIRIRIENPGIPGEKFVRMNEVADEIVQAVACAGEGKDPDEGYEVVVRKL